MSKTINNDVTSNVTSSQDVTAIQLQNLKTTDPQRYEELIAFLADMDPLHYGNSTTEHHINSSVTLELPKSPATTFSTDRHKVNYDSINAVLNAAIKVDQNLAKAYLTKNNDTTSTNPNKDKVQTFYTSNVFKYRVMYEGMIGLLEDILNDDQAALRGVVRSLNYVIASHGFMCIALDSKEIFDNLVTKRDDYCTKYRNYALDKECNCMSGFIGIFDRLDDDYKLMKMRTFFGYCTRFVPEGVTANPEACIRKLLDCNNSMRQIEGWFTSSLPDFNNPECARLVRTLNSLTTILHTVLDLQAWMRVDKALRFTTDLSEYPDHLYFPSGADYEGHKTIAQKALSVLSVWPNYIPIGVYAPSSGHKSDDPIPVRFSAVPKDSGASRGIGVTPCWANALGRQIVCALEEYVTVRTCGGVNLHDQEINRASLDPRYCTTDYSSASDTNCAFIIRTIFPKWFTSYVDQCRPTTVEISGHEPEQLDIYLMMGHTCTCLVQSLYYWSIMIAATQEWWYRDPASCCDYFNINNDGVDILTHLVYDDDVWKQHIAPNFHAYNDDIIYPDALLSDVLDISQALGLRLNTDKTFWGSNQNGYYLKYFNEVTCFRESCGAEAYRTILSANEIKYDLVRFPRSSMPNDLNGLRVAISLQHNFFKNGQYGPARRIGTYLRKLYPELTESDGTDGFEDIWSLWPSRTTVIHTIGVRNGATDSTVGFESIEQVVHSHFVEVPIVAPDIKPKEIEMGAILSYLTALRGGIPRSLPRSKDEHVHMYFPNHKSMDPSYFEVEQRPENVFWSNADMILAYGNCETITNNDVTYKVTKDGRLVYDPVSIISSGDPTSEPTYIRKSALTAQDYRLIIVNR